MERKMPAMAEAGGCWVLDFCFGRKKRRRRRLKNKKQETGEGKLGGGCGIVARGHPTV
jgi:hypothetical protein